MNRPASPWPGSEYSAIPEWELDDATSLREVADRVSGVGELLLAAHVAGWALVSPMSDGRLHARRQSRRRRGRAPDGVSDIPSGALAPPLRRRLRIVDEPAGADAGGLTVDAAHATPWLVAQGGELSQLSGPEIDEDTLAHLRAQCGPEMAAGSRWALVSARVGPSKDLVAEHTRLRQHRVIDGVVVRTIEILGHRHAADRAPSLPAAAAAYRRLALAANAMERAGGHLAAIDDGFVTVEYPV